MRMTKLTWLLTLAALLISACADGGGDPADDELFIVPDGKYDDFLASTAQEYAVEGVVPIHLDAQWAEASEEEQIAEVKRLAPLKQVMIAWFLNAYTIDKSDHDDNEAYGGFHGLTKNGSWEDLGLSQRDALTWDFRFRQEIGGALDLMERLPTQQRDDGKTHFELIVGRVSNEDLSKLKTDREWYRKSPWSGFNPETLDADKKDVLDLTIEPEARPFDAWIDINRLAADGLITVGVHFGWDYHGDYHLKHSEQTYDWLINRGYTSPVATYDELRRDSGPLFRSIKVKGEEVRVEVSLFWGKPGSDTDPDTADGGRALEEDMRTSFREREVTVFNGHSGPFYGFALANWRKTSEGDLDDSEIPGLEMQAGVYQIVLAEGCDTYALGEAFKKNPAHLGGADIDVITTTSFSNASSVNTVKDFLTAVAGTGTSGDEHVPTRYAELLSDMDSNTYWFKTMYGVHSIEDNPRLHPFANLLGFCATCEQDSDCGPQGNRCVTLTGGARVCSAECTAHEACPTGFECRAAASSGWIRYKVCSPTGGDCTITPPEPEGPRVLINEVLVDPPMDLSGDANGDGVREARDDEFIELLNVTADPVDLSGWQITDGYAVRYAFPEGAELMPGRALVLFGGGDPATFAELPGALVFVAEHGLGLNNTGDTITLLDVEGVMEDQVVFGAEAGDGRSLVRATDGDPDAALVPHPGDAPFSAGVRTDGEHF